MTPRCSAGRYFRKSGSRDAYGILVRNCHAKLEILDTASTGNRMQRIEPLAPHRPPLKLRGHAAFLAICVCFLLVELIVISSRRPESDDGWFASPPYNLLHHGHFGTTTIAPRGYLLRPELTHINQRTYWVLPLNLLAQAVWYAVFGFGLAQMRLLTLLFGLLGLVALYRWVVRLTDDRLAASIAALLMAQDNLITWRSADGRMDVMCLSLGLMGQAAYLAWRERSLGKALLVGNTLICLSLLTHPNGIIYFLCLVATVLVLDARRLRLAHILPFASSYFFAGAAYGAWAMCDIQGFKDQLAGNQAANRMALLTHPLNAIIEELTLFRHVFIGAEYDPGKFAPLKVILLVTSVGGYLGQVFVRPLRIQATMVLALCGAIPVGVLTLFNARNAYYLIHIVPFFAANGGILFAYLWRTGTWMRRFVGAAVAVTLLINVAITARRTVAARRENAEFRRLSAVASRMLTPGERMIAPAYFAFGIGMDRVVDDDTQGFYGRWCPALMIARDLPPDEIRNLQKEAPEVLEYRSRVLTVYYSRVDGNLYQRISCPPGARAD